MQDRPVYLMLSHLVSSGNPIDHRELDPNYQYLRVRVHGEDILMASPTPNINDPGVTAIWYSADRAILKLRDGRLVAAIGTPTEWRDVTIPDLPPWKSLAEEKGPTKWVRLRDVMPGYHYGLRDHLVLQRIPAPSTTNLVGVDPRSLIWFEESIQPTSEGAYTDSLPPARYALELQPAPEVVYGEQCLSPSFCLTWQRWPVRARGRP